MNLKKPAWLLLSCLIVLVMVLASCGEKTATQTTAATTVKGTTTQQTTTVKTTAATTAAATTASNEPKYGGELRVVVATDLSRFDDCYPVGFSGVWSLALTNEECFEGDWMRGPAGTGEVTWLLPAGFEAPERFWKEGLCESWEIDSVNNAMILHVQHGIYWHNKAPTNGREMDADDIVFSLQRQWSTAGTFLSGSYPKPEVTAIDNWTVNVDFKTWSDLTNTIVQIGDVPYIWPRDAVTKFGDMRDWKNSIGTGPYIMTDYVKSTSYQFVRNQNYWDTDPTPAGKGNQLPYLDSVKILVITDNSTRLSAMRTQKADQIWPVKWEDAAALKKSNPELKYVSVNNTAIGLLAMREDNPDFPWAKLAVRQAMTMAVDYQTISDTFYGGEGNAMVYQVAPTIEFKDIYISLKEMPEDVRYLFTYHPEEAAQMIKDAGYPNGFDMHVVCWSDQVDLLAIYKDYFADVGVNLILDVKEYGTFNSMVFGKGHTEAIVGVNQNALPFNMDAFRPSVFNASFVQDTKAVETWTSIWADYKDWNKRCQTYKEFLPYAFKQCYNIPFPGYAQYTFWQPWLKGYHGEFGTGNSDGGTFPKWVWLDQDLKYEMTGTR
jgi:ABC-type transport system substrate-binding protein